MINIWKRLTAKNTDDQKRQPQRPAIERAVWEQDIDLLLDELKHAENVSEQLLAEIMQTTDKAHVLLLNTQHTVLLSYMAAITARLSYLGHCNGTEIGVTIRIDKDKDDD